MNTNDASKTGFVGDFMKADLDDLVFQYRNKEYGAYQLRKAYYKRMTRGTILAILLLAFAAALPEYCIVHSRQSSPRRDVERRGNTVGAAICRSQAGTATPTATGGAATCSPNHRFYHSGGKKR
jgi:hypothetical protein